MDITKVCNHAICKIRNKNTKCIRKQKLPTLHQKPALTPPLSSPLELSNFLDKYKNEKEILIDKKDFEYNSHDESFGVGALKLLQNKSKNQIKNLKRKNKKKKPIIFSEKIDGSKLYKSDGRKFFYYRKPSLELKDFLINNENKTFLDYGVYCLKKKMNRFFLDFVRGFVGREKERIRLEGIRELERVEREMEEKRERIRFEKNEKLRIKNEERLRIKKENEEKIRLEKEEKIRLENEEKIRLEIEEKIRLENEEKIRLENEEKIRLENEEKIRLEIEEKEKLAEKNKILEEQRITQEEKQKFKKQKTNLSSDFKTTDNEKTIDFASSNSQKQNINNQKVNYKKLLDLSLKEEDEKNIETENISENKSKSENEENILLISTNEKIKENYFDLEKSNNDYQNLKSSITNIDYEMRMKKNSNSDTIKNLRKTLRESALKINEKNSFEKKDEKNSFQKRDKKINKKNQNYPSEKNSSEKIKKKNSSKKKKSEIESLINSKNQLNSRKDSLDSSYFDFAKKDDLEKKEYVKKMRVATFSRGSNAFQIYQKQQEEKKKDLNKRRSSLNERRVNRRSFIENISKGFFDNKKKSELLKKEEQVREKEREESDSESSFDSSDEGLSMNECPGDMRNSLERESGFFNEVKGGKKNIFKDGDLGNDKNNFGDGKNIFRDDHDKNIFGDDHDKNYFGDENYFGNENYNEDNNKKLDGVGQKNLFLYEEEKNLKNDEIFNLFNKNLEDDAGKRDASPLFFAKKNDDDDDFFAKEEKEQDMEFGLEDDGDIEEEFFSGHNKRKSRTEKVSEFENLISIVKKKRKSERQERRKSKIEEKKKKKNSLNQKLININPKSQDNLEEKEIQKKSESQKSSEDINNFKENVLSTQSIDKLKINSLRENPSISENQSYYSNSQKSIEKNSSKKEENDLKNKEETIDIKEIDLKNKQELNDIKEINLKNKEELIDLKEIDLKKNYKKKKTEEEIKMKRNKSNITNSELDESSEISSFDEKSKELEKKSSLVTDEDIKDKNMKKIQAVLKKLTDNLDSEKILTTIKEERFSIFAKSEKKKMLIKFFWKN